MLEGDTSTTTTTLRTTLKNTTKDTKVLTRMHKPVVMRGHAERNQVTVTLRLSQAVPEEIPMTDVSFSCRMFALTCSRSRTKVAIGAVDFSLEKEVIRWFMLLDSSLKDETNDNVYGEYDKNSPTIQANKIQCQASSSQDIRNQKRYSNVDGEQAYDHHLYEENYASHSNKAFCQYDNTLTTVVLSSLTNISQTTLIDLRNRVKEDF